MANIFDGISCATPAGLNWARTTPLNALISVPCKGQEAVVLQPTAPLIVWNVDLTRVFSGLTRL